MDDSSRPTLMPPVGADDLRLDDGSGAPSGPSLLSPHATSHSLASRRRRRRQTITFLVLLLGILGVGGTAAVLFLGWKNSSSSSPTGTPSASSSQCAGQASQPADETTVRVYNGSGRKGLAATTQKQLKARAFTVNEIGNDPNAEKITGVVAVLRTGPNGMAAARTVAAQVNGAVKIESDGRVSDTVDLVLGPAFKTLRTPSAANAALAASVKKACAAGAASPQPLVTPSSGSKASASPKHS